MASFKKTAFPTINLSADPTPTIDYLVGVPANHSLDVGCNFPHYSVMLIRANLIRSILIADLFCSNIGAENEKSGEYIATTDKHFLVFLFGKKKLFTEHPVFRAVLPHGKKMKKKFVVPSH